MKKPAVRAQIIKTFRYLMGGIVRLALRNGINVKEFSDLCKSVYVDVASKEYGIEGRTTNTSRVALMTGLDRRDIKRISDAINKEEDLPVASPPSRMAKILAGWYTDKQYLSKLGEPLTLPVEGKSPSFESLIKDYGGDIASVTVLREFKRSFTVVDTEDGTLKVNARYYIPNYQASAEKAPDFVNPEAIAHGSSMLIDHINTIFHNLYRHDMDQRERFEMRVANRAVETDKIADFYKMIDERGMQFLIEVGDWLDSHETKDLSVPHERLGLGLYFIQGENAPFTKKQ